MTVNENLDIILRRYEELGARLDRGRRRAPNTRELSREFAELEPIAAAIRALRAKEKERADLDAMLADPALDAEMRAMAEDELAAAEADAEAMAQAIRIALLPKDAADEGNVDPRSARRNGRRRGGAVRRRPVPHVSSNTRNRSGWKVEVLSASEGTAGGYKEIIAEIAGRGAFARLKYESGVHRVQRVPATETQGRIHTSAATVAVMPEAQEIDLVINEARPQDRHHALERRRRPARQQDGIGDPHHPSADRRRRRGAGGALAAQEPRQGDGAAALAHPRREKPEGRTRSAPRSGARRSAPATARSASAPTISRKGG